MIRLLRITAQFALLLHSEFVLSPATYQVFPDCPPAVVQVEPRSIAQKMRGLSEVRAREAETLGAPAVSATDEERDPPEANPFAESRSHPREYDSPWGRSRSFDEVGSYASLPRPGLLRIEGAQNVCRPRVPQGDVSKCGSKP